MPQLTILLNVNLIFPEDQEYLALTLGGRKRKIRRSDFDQFALSLGIANKVRDNIYVDFQKQKDHVEEMIARSFLTKEYKLKYVEIFQHKMKQLGF